MDGLRGIAALLVIYFHFFIGIQSSNSYENILGKLAVFGQSGVSLFFVISGFLITRILLLSKETNYYFRNFYIRRALRIFPLYYLFLFIFYFIEPLLSSINIKPTGIAFWLYLQNFYMTFQVPMHGPDHFWSLAVEEHFYLFWPFIVYIFSTKNTLLFGTVLILIAFILRFILYKNGYEVFYFTFTRIDELILGAFLAVLEFKKKLTFEFKRYYITLFVILIFFLPMFWFFFNSEAILFIQVLRFPMIGLFYFSVIGTLLCLRDSHVITKIISNKYFSYTGKISYGLYVFHPMVFFYVKLWMPNLNILANFVLSLASVYIVASISYFYFEKKFLDLKDKLTYNKS